jgi:hypothetical protein
MLTGDDLSTQYFIAGAALAVLGVAVTQAGWNHRWFLRGAFGLGIVLFGCAALWSPIISAFPKIGELTNPIGSSSGAWLTLLTGALIVIFWLDYRARSRRRDSVGLSAEQVQSLEARIEQVKGRLYALEETGGADLGARLSVTELTRELENLEKNVIRNNGKIHAYEQSNLHTLNGLIEQLTHSLLFDSVPRLPVICSLRDLTPEIMIADKHKGEEYWREVRNLLSNTRWGYELRMIEENADSTAEFAIRDIPIEARPRDIDPMDLRRFAVIKYRAENANGYVEGLKGEARTSYQSCLSRLQELMAQAQEASKTR